MKPPKLPKITTMFPMKPFVNGLTKIKLKPKKLKVVIEDTISHPKIKLPKINNQSSMLESHPLNKKTTSKTKLISLNPNIQTINLSQISVPESISKEKDLSPFWTKSLNQMSKKLWSPIKTDLLDLDSNLSNISVKNLDARSKLFQKKNITQVKNYQKTSSPLLQFYQPKTQNSVNIQKTKKIRIYPSEGQIELFKDCFNISRYIYNQCIEYNNQIYQTQLEEINKSQFCQSDECNKKKVEESFFCKKHQNSKIKWDTINRPISMREHVLLKEKDLPDDKKWLAKIPYDTKELMIRSYCTSLQTNMQKGGKFNISFKSKKNPSQIFFVNKKALKVEDNNIHIFKKRLKSDSLIFKKKTDVIEIEQNCIIQKDGKKYYILMPMIVKTKYEKAKNNIVSLDPGVRSFQTFYSPDGICGELNLRTERIKKLKNKIEKLRTIRRGRCHRLRTKINNIISNSHWHLIKFLISNFNTIIIPHFQSKNMISNKRKGLHKQVKKDMMDLCHFKFLEKLKYKCIEHQRQLIICEESYTSKTCSSCGWLNNKLGSNKTYECKKCNIIIDRDINGAKNILQKSLDLMQSIKNNCE